MPRGSPTLRPASILATAILATAGLAAACGGAAPGSAGSLPSQPAGPGAVPISVASPAPAAGGATSEPAVPDTDWDAGRQSDYPCRKWLTLDEPMRTAVIEKAIELAKAQGVIIRLPASGYVAALDRLIESYRAGKNEKALDSPLGLAFHILAAMEGDWDDGESKVEHAKRWLGPKLFEAFREKYPAKYQHLVELDRAAVETGK